MITGKNGISVFLTLLSIAGLFWLYQIAENYLHVQVNIVKVEAKPVDLQSVDNKDREFNDRNSLRTSQDYISDFSNHLVPSSKSPFGVDLHNDSDIIRSFQNISQIIQVQRRKYSVISASTPTISSVARYNYVFSIPLAILAWKRIGFETIVLISGKAEDWERESCLKVIKEYMDDLNAHSVFLNVPEENLVMMSQVSRLYAASILSDMLKEEDYLVTSDVDLWPIDSVAYALPRGKQILVLNADCCGSFRHKGVLHHTVAMGNVGATVKTWKEIIVAKGDNMPKNSSHIMDIFVKEFGDIANRRTVKGENDGWYLDQHMLTLLLASWMSKNNISLVQFVPRNLGGDRIDRSWWSTNRIDGKVDAHVLNDLHLTSNWVRVLPLFRLMFGSDMYSSMYSMILLYFNDFSNAMATQNTFS